MVITKSTVSACRVRAASIEPSLFSDGNAKARIIVPEYMLASIEPSLFSDGNGVTSAMLAYKQKRSASIEPSLFSDGNY